MSKSVNKVLLLGNVGKDPEVHNLRSGIVVNLSLATNESFKDGRGDWQERVEWHNLVAYQRTAEIIRDYVRKGSRIYIEGKLRTDSWDDKTEIQEGNCCSRSKPAVIWFIAGPRERQRPG